MENRNSLTSVDVQKKFTISNFTGSVLTIPCTCVSLSRMNKRALAAALRGYRKQTTKCMEEADKKKEKKKRGGKKRKEKRKKNPWRGRIKCEEGGIFKWASSLLRLEYVTSGISLSLFSFFLSPILPSLSPWVFLRYFSQYENIVRVILKPARNVFLF